jgi:hypothetical protein
VIIRDVTLCKVKIGLKHLHQLYITLLSFLSALTPDLNIKGLKMKFEIPVMLWLIALIVLAMLAGYSIGHKDGYKQGTQVGYRRGSKSVSQ